MMQAGNLAHAESSLTLFDDPVRFFSGLDRSILHLYAMRKLPAIDGALGRNRQGFQSICHQCGALDFVIFGVATRQRRYVESGLRALACGFKHQEDDGGFITQDGAEDSGNGVTQAAQFIACAAMAVVMLSRSELRRRYLKPLAQLRAGIARCIDWLYPHHQALLRDDGQARHRLLYDALAFSLSAELLRSPLLLQKGWLFQTVPLLLLPAANAGTEVSASQETDEGLETLLLLYFLIFVSKPFFVNEILDALVPGVETMKSHILKPVTAAQHPADQQDGNRDTVSQLCHLNGVKSLWLYAYIAGDQASWRAGKQILQTLTLQTRRRIAMLNGASSNPVT